MHCLGSRTTHSGTVYLIEDGPKCYSDSTGRYQLDQGTPIKGGVLHSIASKNNHEDAMAVLRDHGLAQYFVYPQISWQPKSEGIAQIATLLNIGIDTLAFVDDQPFEREEVQGGAAPSFGHRCCHMLRVIAARPECQVPVTAERSRPTG